MPCFSSTSSAEPESAIHFASVRDINMPFVVSISSTFPYRCMVKLQNAALAGIGIETHR